VIARTSTEPTLKDRLSRLTFAEASKLLGQNGRSLILRGGRYDVALGGNVHLDDERFAMDCLDATVSIMLSPKARGRLAWQCSRCDGPCEHAGAAFSLILEEKTALGLAAPPPEAVPLEGLSEEELVRRAFDERMERASSEKMTVRSVEPERFWTDYLATSSHSGKTYRVALRGWEPGESYCSCPDFRKNTLGTCKHVLHVQGKAKRRFAASKRRQRYKRKGISIHIRYGKTMELRFLLPDNLDRAVEAVVRPLRDRPIEDVGDLMKRIRKLEALGQEVLIYPDAEEHIEQRLFREWIGRTVAEIRKDPRNHPLRRSLLKAELLPYQLDGIAFAVGAGRAVLADDMGLGKTIQGIGVAEMLAREAGIGKVLIICPATLKAQWLSEIQRFSNRSAQLILGGAAERSRQYDSDAFFTVCNYEQVLRDILTVERVEWDLVILDEGQRIKNWEAKTSRTVKGIRSRFSLVLSGTPLENRLDDLFSVVEFVDDRLLGPAFRFFNRHRVCNEKGKVLGYRHMRDLRKRLAPVLLRRTRQSVMLELPARSTEIVRITPTEEQLDVHNAHLRVVSSIVRKRFINEMDLLRLRKALLMCRMAADSTFLVDKQAPGYSSKLEELNGLLDQLQGEEGRKIVLFSEWTTMLGLIEPLLEQRGMAYVRLDGSVPQKKRQALVREFQHNGKCKLFVTTNAGATGLNLQAANTVINVDLPWNPAVLEQRISRAHRMGQKSPVQVFVLVTDETIEEKLLTTLSAKHELALAALDPESDKDTVELVSGIEELKRRLEILLGAAPAAPLDVSARAAAEQEAEKLARRERVAAAGGELLSAAVAFLSELMPKTAASEQSRRLASAFRESITECTDTDPEGRVKLTFTLPDSAALDALADSFARVVSARK